MTPSVTAPSLRPFPRFTFAGRGCRDPRREVRRHPAALLTRPTAAAAALEAIALTSEGSSRPAQSDDKPAVTAARPAADDRPPPDGRPARPVGSTVVQLKSAFVYRDTAEIERQLPRRAVSA